MGRIKVFYRKIKAKIWMIQHEKEITEIVNNSFTPEARKNPYHTYAILEGLKKELDVIIHITDNQEKEKVFREFHQRNRKKYIYLFGEDSDMMHLLNISGGTNGNSSIRREKE